MNYFQGIALDLVLLIKNFFLWFSTFVFYATPLLPSYTRLRAHLRIEHGVTDKEFDFRRDEPRFRHTTLFRHDDRANAFHGNMYNQRYGATIPPTSFDAGNVMQAFGIAISGAIQEGNKFHTRCP